MNRVLAIMPDAFGGRGGIAKYNRDLLTVLCSYPTIQEVVGIPRNIVDSVGSLPDKLTYVKKGADGKIQFAITAFQSIFSGKFDLIICGHINLLPLAYAMQRLNPVPLFLMLYGVEAWQPSAQKFSNYLTRHINGLISISDITLKRFQQWATPSQAESFLLPNAVQLEGYAPGMKSEELLQQYSLHDKTILLTLGRIVGCERYKGFDEIIEVLPKLLHQYPNLVYLVAGEGNDVPRLITKTASLNLEQHVIFTGYIPENRKADYYRLADAFVMPSQGEGFGFVLLEAMACGIPVMGSNLDGTREALLNGRLGTLIDPTNLEAVYSGVLETLKRPRIVPAGLDYFSFGNFQRRCHAILDQVLVT